MIASFLVTGSISWLYYADRLLEFPLGLFGIGIATVILPALSSLHAKQNSNEFSQTLDWALRVVCLFSLPAMVGLIVLAKPIIMILFMRGEFDQVVVLQVSYALYAYLAGLISFMFIKVLAPGYYARQDTKTPVKIGIKAMVANMAFNLMLAPFFGYVGLAIATAMSATLNAFWLYQGLKQQNIFTLTRTTWFFLIKMLIAALMMAAGVYSFSPRFEIWLTMEISAQIVQLVLIIGMGLLAYFSCLFLLGIRFNDVKITKIKTVT